ncbi:MAG: Ig-like domain-containing protein, partial [Clostridium sp.]
MVNKFFSSKLCLFLLVVVSLFLFVPNTALSAENVIQMEHETNVTTNKEWTITFNRAINGYKLSERVKVYDPRGITVPIITSYHNNIITVKPPVSGYVPGQTYSLQIFETITDLDSSPLKAAVTMNFTIAVPTKGNLKDAGNMKYIYQQYSNTLNQIVDIQSAVRPVNVVRNYYLDPSSKDIYEYMNPKNFEYHEYALYQFLKLNYIEGITAQDLDIILQGKGILAGQGKTFLDAC